MSKKPAGLGRGLGDLLEDNAPEIKKNTSRVVIRTDNKNVSVSTAELYPQKPKTRALRLITDKGDMQKWQEKQEVSEEAFTKFMMTTVLKRELIKP